MFDQVRLRGRELVSIQPKTTYQPLFAYAVTEGVRKCRGGQIRTADLLVPNQAPCRWATPRELISAATPGKQLLHFRGMKRSGQSIVPLLPAVTLGKHPLGISIE